MQRQRNSVEVKFVIHVQKSNSFYISRNRYARRSTSHILHVLDKVNLTVNVVRVRKHVKFIRSSSICSDVETKVLENALKLFQNEFDVFTSFELSSFSLALIVKNRSVLRTF